MDGHGWARMLPNIPAQSKIFSKIFSKPVDKIRKAWYNSKVAEYI
jgi:hypothetical protein